MRMFIEGYNQNALISLGLDLTDAIILRYIVDFFHSSKIRKLIVEDKEYMWVSYQKVVDDLPILGINRRTIAKKFEKYVNCGLMEKYLCVKQGNFTYFRFTALFDSLISDSDDFSVTVSEDNIQNEGTLSQQKTSAVQSEEVCSADTRPLLSAEQTKIVVLNSIISIDKLNNNYVESSAIEVLEYLNKLGSKKFKPIEGNLKHIRARLKEGFSVEQLKKVIELKVDEWIDNEKMKVYIRPQTLFNSEKFDCYLNNAPVEEAEIQQEEIVYHEELPENEFVFDPENIKNPKLKEKYLKYFHKSDD